MSLRARCLVPKSLESTPSPGWITAPDCFEASEYLKVFAKEEEEADPLPLYTLGAKRGPACAQCPSGIECRKSTVGTVASMRPRANYWLLPKGLRRSFGDTAECIGDCIDGKCKSPYGPLCGHCEVEGDDIYRTSLLCMPQPRRLPCTEHHLDDLHRWCGNVHHV